MDALREKGCVVKGMVAIFTYGFDEAVNNFKNANCSVETLTNYNALINTALEKEYVDQKDIVSLKEWRTNPAKWSEGVVKED